MLATWGTSTGRNPTLDLQFAGATSLDDRITFSRGSQATLFDSTGALVYAKHNLQTYSEDFANAAWSKTNSSITSNTVVAPDGTLTGDKLVEDTATGEHAVGDPFSFTSGTTYTGTIYAKKAERTLCRFGAGNAATWEASVVVDLSNGTITSTVAGSGTVADVGNGWYRISVTGAALATANTNFGVRLVSTGTTISYTGDGTSGIFIWGAQLNLPNMEGGVTSSLSTYYPTVASAYYAPRFDYNPSTLAAQGLLIEEQRTNSIRNNTMQGAVVGTPGTLPTNWSVASGASGMASEVIGTGTENGITYIDIRWTGTPGSSSTLQHSFEVSNNIAAASGQTWTASNYQRLVSGAIPGAVSLIVIERSAANAFLTSSSTVGTVDGSALSVQRITHTRTLNNASTAFVAMRLDVSVTSGVAVDFTLRIGLPQLELGAFATSVIPTTTTALTRNADVASMTGTNFSSWYNQSEGTLFSQASLISSSYTGGVLVDVGAGGAFGTTEYIAWTGSAWTLNPNTAPINVISSVTTTSTAKVAAGMKVNDSVIAGNGLIGVTDTSCSIASAPTTLSIGKAGWTAGNYLNGWIQRISYYPSRLPNTTLQALTA